MGHHRQHGELRLAQRLVTIGHLGDALGADDPWYEDPVAEIDRLGGPSRDRRVGRHHGQDEPTLVARAGGDRIERPRVPLAVLALELDFEDGAEHRLLLFVEEVHEQHDGVGVVLDRHELRERCLAESRLAEPRNVDVQEVAEQAGGKRRVVPDQRDHALVHQRWRRHDDNATLTGPSDNRQKIASYVIDNRSRLSIDCSSQPML